MKNVIRTFCMLLAILMLLPIFASCGPNQSEADTTANVTNPPSDAPTSAPEETKETYVLPEEHDYNGYLFNVLVGAYSQWNDFKVVDDSTDVLNEARFRWLEAAKEEFNIDIDYYEEYNFNSPRGGGPGYLKLQSSYTASDYQYNISSVNVYDVANASLSGYLYDIKQIDYIDLEKSWWDQKANEQLSIRDKLYFTTGDISTIDNMVTQCVYFNKTLLAELGLDDPYQLVEEDKWYWDKFVEMVLTVSNDENGDDIMDEHDKYGLLTYNDVCHQLFAFAGEAVSKVNANGEIELTVYNDRTQKIFEQYTNLFHDLDHVISYQYRKGTIGTNRYNEIRIPVFTEGRALFHFNSFEAIMDYRDADVDFGILPWPKYDNTQADYGHLMTPFSSQMFSVPMYHDDDEIVGAVSEYLAATGQETTKVAYYEKALKGTYFRDDESAAMLDIIFATHAFDVGIYFRVGMLYSNIYNSVNARNPSFTVVCQGSKRRSDSDIKTINDAFASLD